MDQHHRRLARLALAEAGAFGFCLAGGYAVQAHGFLERPSEDVDLFTTTASEEHFSDALAAVVRAYEADRLDVTMTMANPGFARLQVTDPTTGTTAKVELGIDWRAHPPVTLAIGPVLHPDDAVPTRSAPSTPEPRHATSSTSTPSSAPAATPATNCSRSRRSTTPASARTCSCWHSAPSADFPWPSSSPTTSRTPRPTHSSSEP